MSNPETRDRDSLIALVMKRIPLPSRKYARFTLQLGELVVWNNICSELCAFGSLPTTRRRIRGPADTTMIPAFHKARTSEDLFQDSEGREGSEPIEEHQFSDLEESDDDDDNEDDEDEEEEESQDEPPLKREASPLRCVSPRLELSPSRHLSPRRELSPRTYLPPEGEVSPVRHSSPSREMSSVRYLSLKKVLSPGCSESSRFFGKNVQLYESKLAPHEIHVHGPSRGEENVFSHLPLHSQQLARTPYPMIPIGGIQMVQARPSTHPSLVPSSVVSLQAGYFASGGSSFAEFSRAPKRDEEPQVPREPSSASVSPVAKVSKYTLSPELTSSGYLEEKMRTSELQQKTDQEEYR
ncbi:PREDICTED: transcription factor HIVEP3-like, partial [Leptosomus discolor]|uniref:transcription factor HIVEP3-like n=1 Tax=Leptosomus discolor TaxID=188344 RepID=UPI000522874C